MRSASCPLVLALVLLVGACGDDAATLETAVAEDLAGRADVLAAQLEAGDACGARGTAGALVTVTSQARDAGTVPEPIAAEVIATARDLVRDVTCDPEPTPAPTPPADADDHDDDDGRGKGEGKGKGKGKGKNKDKDDGDRDGRGD